MLDKDTLIKVTNRSYGTVGYKVDDLGINREYQPGETKEILLEELLKLSYSIGGKRLIEKYLVIDNEQAVYQILGEVEPEYFYTKDEVIQLLTNGTDEQLQDCLDFAETGVIDLVKKLAVDLNINSVNKREIIKEKTGFDVDSAINVKRITEEDSPAQETTHRRAAPITTSANEPKRRTELPKYKVVS